MTFHHLSNSDRPTLGSEDGLNGNTAHGQLVSDLGAQGEAASDRGIVVLKELLHDLNPCQKPGVWVYAQLPIDKPCPTGTAFTVIEDEGRTVVLAEEDAKSAGLEQLFRAAWITLRVHSALEAFGLVAHVSARLADAAIPCNIIAGARHDHILVPYDSASEALKALRELQLLE